MPTPSTRPARAARKESRADSRRFSNAAPCNVSSAASRKLSIPPRRGTARLPPGPWNSYPGAGPIVDPETLAELSRRQREIKREFLLLKRHIAWQRVIDDAIRVCRLLRKVELAEALKYRPDQPRVPAGNPDGGQWVNDGGSGVDVAAAAAAAAGVAWTAPPRRPATRRWRPPDSGKCCRPAVSW